MSITYQDLYDFSCSIFDAQTLEVELRAACSSAYYAVWHCSDELDKLLIDSSGQASSDKGGVHIERINKFAGFPLNTNQDRVSPERARDIRAIGHMMKMIKGHRFKADYKLDADFSASDCKVSIEGSNKAIDKITQICSLLQQVEAS